MMVTHERFEGTINIYISPLCVFILGDFILHFDLPAAFRLYQKDVDAKTILVCQQN